MGSPQNLLLPGWTTQLSLSLIMGDVFHTSHQFHGPPLDLLSQVHIFLMLYKNRDEHNIPEGASWEPSRRAESPPSTAPHGAMHVDQGIVFWAGSGQHVDSSRPAFHPQETLSPSPQDCFKCLLLPLSAHFWDCHDPTAGSCTWTHWTSWDLHPSLKPTHILSDWHPLPPTSSAHKPYIFCGSQEIAHGSTLWIKRKISQGVDYPEFSASIL